MSADPQTPGVQPVPASPACDSLRSVWELERRTESQWNFLRSACQEAETTIKKLSDALAEKFASQDYSVVVFGSLARREFTESSDLDWTLLVDGAASDDHWEVACRVRDTVRPIVSKEPGREGTFGNLAFSHELFHQIGGADDSNRNTTRRILLLLESLCCSSSEAYDRVIRGILKRYLTEDEAFLHWRSHHPVPRFLLNDFARFWWTMAVDFAYKKRTRQGEGAVIRNLKLRMSRKLIYAAGLLACFSLALDADRARRLRDLEKSEGVGERLEHFRVLLSKPPLEILASHLVRHPHLNYSARQLFTAYDCFLGALSARDKRETLERLKDSERYGNPLYQEVRKATHEFRDGLLEMFFDGKSGIEELTKTYGVF